MKLAGHTMGTPEYTLKEAMKLFSDIGLDGIEIIVETDGYKCAVNLNANKDKILEIKELARGEGLEIAAVTPYMNAYNSLDEKNRIKACDDLKKVIDMATLLEAPSIRVYGGKLLTGEKDKGDKKLYQLIKSMRECGDYAGKSGVKLCMENHFGTMTTNAARTAKIVNLIDHPNVGILYDQANIAFFPAEEYKEAIALQRDKIYHVHVKDLIYRDGPVPMTFSEVSHIKEEERTVHSRIPGEGILNWSGILQELKDIGYEGWLSLEYERRWQTIDLPEASIGMKRATHYIRSCISNLK